MYQCSLLSLCKNTPGCFEQQDSPGVCQVTLSEHANFIVHFGTWWCITKLGLVAKASAVHCIVCIVSKTKVLRAKVIVNMELFFRNLTLTVNKPWRYSEVLLNIPRFSLYTHTHKHKHTHTQTHIVLLLLLFFCCCCCRRWWWWCCCFFLLAWVKKNCQGEIMSPVLLIWLTCK